MKCRMKKNYDFMKGRMKRQEISEARIIENQYIFQD